MIIAMKIRGIFLGLIFTVSVPSFALQGASGGEPAGYCVSVKNTPVLNTPDFRSVFGGADGKTLKLDSSGLLRELEFIAFPGTVFTIHERIPGSDILRVSTPDYPYNDDALFIDRRFVAEKNIPPRAGERAPPPAAEIIRKLESMLGQEYLWGGNTDSGVPCMAGYYGPEGSTADGVMRIWELMGVDCSGLLYFAADGYTPRNTSSLVNFGEGLDIAGLDADEIARLLRPLDLIAWAGHVIIVMNEDSVIESSLSGGVHKSPVSGRLEELLRARAPADDRDGSSGRRFVVRRWLK